MLKDAIIVTVLTAFFILLSYHAKPYPSLVAVASFCIAIAAAIRLSPTASRLLSASLPDREGSGFAWVARLVRSWGRGADECLAFASLFLAVASLTAPFFP